MKSKAIKIMAEAKNLITICGRCKLLWIFYISKDIDINFVNCAKPNESSLARILQLARDVCAN
jgi:hypothetical protein